jgi:glucans biosynthesis protein
VFYNKRPSVWVEPLDGWGRGAVQLVEIPTDDEIHDNIVAYWVPEAPFEPGHPIALRYRIHWNRDEPFPAATARVVASYIGLGGVPGNPRPDNQKKFVIDFVGDNLNDYGVGDGVTPIVSASRGEVSQAAAYPILGDKGRFRCLFDLTFADEQPIDLRLYLTVGDKALSETWIYQYFPSLPDHPPA